VKVYSRALIALALIAAWSFAAVSGFLLWLAPSGPRSGWQVLAFGLTKHQWGSVHFWTSVGALAVTVIHLIIDWRALRACLRHLTSIHRQPLTHK
jgi:hypothetical protein